MPEDWDDDGPAAFGDSAGGGRARGSDADVREAEADAREAAADRRELRIDARELVLDRWEQEIAARAAALGLTDDAADQRRAQRRVERVADGHARRDQAEVRREAAIERDIRRVERGSRDRSPGAPAPEAGSDPLPDSFLQLAGALTGGAALTDVLGLVLAAVVDSVPDCDAASIALITQGRVEVAATTAPWAAHLDERQVELASGPLLSAIAGDRVMVTADLGGDERWPALAAVDGARRRATMSFALGSAGHEGGGALTVYSRPGCWFGPEAATTGQFLAALAAVALARSSERLTHEAQAQAWQSALASRDAIGQAKGMLMEQRSISADEAFDLLRVTSQRLNLKVKDIAVHLVEHRQMPR